MMKLLKELIYPLIISLISYILYFYPLFMQGNTIYSGKDSVRLHYASRFYLYENISNSNYPFWTERMFGGYPIYADLERGYQNVFNLALTYFFGPITSYKLLHIITYLLGSLCLYIILKKHEGNLLTFAIGNTVYFFSFFTLIHQQHFNFILSIYLLPAVLLTTIKLIETKQTKYILINMLLIYFLISFGAIQMIFILGIVVLLYLIFFLEVNKNFWKIIGIQLIGLTIISFPSINSFYNLYLESSRKEFFNGQGNLDINNYFNLIYPFTFGVDDYKGELLNSYYVKNENSLYLGVSIVLVLLAILFSNINRKIKVYLITTVILFLLLNVSFIPFINIFRYWVRGELIIVFSLILGISYFISKIQDLKINKLFWLPLVIALLPVYFNENVYFILKQSLSENKLIPIMWLLLFVFTIITILYKFKFQKYILIVIIFADLFFFNFFLDKNMFMEVSKIKYEKTDDNNILNSNHKDELSLFKNINSTFGYGALEPKSELNYEKELKNFNDFKINILISLILSLIYLLFLKYKKVLR